MAAARRVPRYTAGVLASEPPKPFLLRPGFLTQFMPALLYLTAIFYAGSTPSGPSLGLNFWSADKLLHFIGFGGLELVFFRAFDWWSQGRAAFRRTAWLALSAAIAAGGLLELFQATLPYRSADVLDWLADALGAIAAVGAHLLVRRIFRATDASEPSVLSARD